MKKHCTSLLSLLSFISLALPNASLANYAIVLPGQHEQGNNLQGSAVSADK